MCLPADPLGLFRNTSSDVPKQINAQPDPEAERKQAEAEATQRANAQIAERQRRRRSQQNMIALGGDADTLGAGGQADPYAGITGQPAQVNTGTASRRNAISGGAFGYGGGYGMGGGGYSQSRQ